MNIIYASDDNYAEIAGVSILSLFENNKDIEDVTVFMLDTNISAENKDRLLSIAKTYSRQIVFVDMPDMEKITGTSLDVGNWSLAAFARLFITSLLPDNIDKIIYLDCDTIIRGSINDFWNHNIENYMLAGIIDIQGKWVKKNIFLNPTNLYVNSGVMLINLNLWRKYNVEEKFVNFIKLFNGNLFYPDQDIINGILSNYITYVAPKYDYMLGGDFVELSYAEQLKVHKPVKYYSEDEINALKADPVIVHLLGIFKSSIWINKDPVHYLVKEWMEYRNMTPWAQFPIREVKMKKKSAIKKILSYTRHHLPRCFYLSYRSFRIFLKYVKKSSNIKKTIKQSDIKLENCYVKLDKK